jgi:hypothetical protein
MENEIQSNIPQTQPLTQVPTPVSTPTNWVKIILFISLGIVVVIGSVFVGIQVGKNQIPNQQPIAVQPTALPTEKVIYPTSLPITSITETPTVDPTANWKTYTNSTYKFLIKYPNNWISKSYTPADSRIPYLYNPDNKYDIQFGYNKDEPSVISEMTGKPMVTDLSNYNPTTINGIKVYVNKNLQGNDGNYMKYYFQISDGEYISILAPLTNAPSNVVWNDAAVSLAKQILLTFNFTN